jgi:putative transposase
MAKPSRHGRIAGTYFVTSRTWESRALFVSEFACRIFVETLLHYRAEEAYHLDAFVLMPDHFHALITPAGAKTLERVMQYIKGGSAHRIREELRFAFPVWQRGFSDHRIRGPEDYAAHLDYIKLNPMKRRLTRVATEYVWSSASGRFPLDEPPQRLKPQPVPALLRHG